MLQELGLRQVYVDFNTESIGTLYAKEGEVNSRGLLIQLVHKGKIVQNNDFIVSFFGSTQDGLVYQRNAVPVIEKPGLYKLIYPSNMLKSGYINAEIRLFQGNNNIATKTFDIEVDSKIVSDDLIEGIDEPDLLTKLLEAAVNEQIRIDNEEIRIQNEIERIEYIDELKQGLAGDAELSSIGKTLISEAINDKGVPSLPDDTFLEMSNQIREIHTPILRGVRDMSNAFAETEEDVIDLRFVDTSRLWNANRMFLNTKANIIDLSMNDLGDLSDVQYMFQGATINELRTKYSDTKLITNAKYMFEGANIGSSLKISEFIDTRNVSNMQNMFSGLSVPELDLSGLDISNISDIDVRGIFSGLNVPELDLSTFDVSQATSIDEMFSNANIPVLNIGGLFKFNNLTSISSAFNSLNTNTLDLSSFNFNQLAAVVNINDNVFKNCKIDTVILPKSDNNTRSMAGWFSGADINNINLEDLDTSKVSGSLTASTFSGMDEMFKDCKMTYLNLSNFDTSKVIRFKGMFEGCHAEILDLSTFDTSAAKQSNMDNMFRNCHATVGYARTQNDADKFNATSNKPAHLVFIVKPEGVE